jgi:hypothetical protein
VTEEQLKGAPRFSRSSDWDWSNPAKERDIDDYYAPGF